MTEAGRAMQRHDDWLQRLNDFLAVARGRAYAPGQHDCALFAAGAVAAMTGVDLAAEWRGRYRTLRSGQRALRAAGYTDHVEFVAAHFEAIPVALAGVGDLAVIRTDDGAALGVVTGPLVAVLRPDQGLGFVSLLAAERAFRV